MRKLWDAGAGRLDPKIEAFLSSLAVDRRMLIEDLEGSRAHAKMLGACSIIGPDVAQSLEHSLSALLELARQGKLEVNPEAEDVHSFIEATLTQEKSEMGMSVHAGRSRNDQVCLDLRLWLRSRSKALRESILVLVGALSRLAASHKATIMPGYTHMQRAQAVTLAHHLLAWCAALERDFGRLDDAAKRANENPLGAGALAGSGLPLDRAHTTASLGFDHPTRNSIDTVADRDFAMEFASAASIALVHLSRFCEELVLWTSSEFGFAMLGEDCSTGSSIMPHKRNPDTAELIRGKAAGAIGAVTALLALEKGLPLAYNRDLQEDKPILLPLADTALSCFGAFTTMMASIEFDSSAMERAAHEGALWAADAAEFLVMHGQPFRHAYSAAKALVAAWQAACEPGGLGRAASIAGVLTRLGSEGLAALHEGWKGTDPAVLCRYLDLEACIERRNVPGGPASHRIDEELERLAAWILEKKAALV